VTADEIGDPQTLEMNLTVNGEARQHSTTADMIFHRANRVVLATWIGARRYVLQARRQALRWLCPSHRGTTSSPVTSCAQRSNASGTLENVVKRRA
jgi:hypothetical protein